MFDWLRNLGKSAEEKRQEALTAYLDNGLTSQERQAFEQQLGQDSGLRSAFEQQRQLKLQLAKLPRVRAPRNFTLDPAVYGRRQEAAPNRTYPILRTATVLVAFFFVMALVVDWQVGNVNQESSVAMEMDVPAPAQATGGDVQSEAIEAETVAESEPTEAAEAEEMDEEAEEAVELLPSADSAAGEAAASATPLPQGTATNFNVQEPAVLNPAEDEAAPAPADGPRPEPTATLIGRDVTGTATPLPTLLAEDDTVETAAETPAPQPTMIYTDPPKKVPTLRILEFALGGILVILLVFALLARRRL